MSDSPTEPHFSTRGNCRCYADRALKFTTLLCYCCHRHRCHCCGIFTQVLHAHQINVKISEVSPRFIDLNDFCLRSWTESESNAKHTQFMFSLGSKSNPTNVGIQTIFLLFLLPLYRQIHFDVDLANHIKFLIYFEWAFFLAALLTFLNFINILRQIYFKNAADRHTYMYKFSRY